jgi:hypothetical protein
MIAIGIQPFFNGLMPFFLTLLGRLDDVEKGRHPVFRNLAAEAIPDLRRQSLAQVFLDRESGIPAANNLPAGKLPRLPFTIGKGNLPAESRTTSDPFPVQFHLFACRSFSVPTTL